MTAINKNENGFALVENMTFTQFMNWFNASYHNRDDYGLGFTHEVFRAMCADYSAGYDGLKLPEILRSSDFRDMDPGKIWAIKQHLNYAVLRNAYETGMLVDVAETKQGKYWAYELGIYAVGKQRAYVFKSAERHPEFSAWERKYNNRELAKKLMKLTDVKPVLCLESKTDLCRRAISEIIAAKDAGYYTLDDYRDEYCNYLEIRTDWMHYDDGPDFSMTGDGKDLCEYAMEDAWKYVRTGVLTGFMAF